MKKLTLKSTLIALACVATSVSAAELTGGCAIKAQQIQKQIEYAQAFGNSYRVAGLKKALTEVQVHCNDQKFRKELEKKVAQKEEKVAERQADLAKAQAKGDLKKIAKQEKKLKEAKEELLEAKKELGNYFK